MPRRSEPYWLPRWLVDAIHTEQLREHGGLPGVRDENALESALNRARQKWTYDERDVIVLAAAYGFGITRSHPYRDGNKRIAFLALVTFLGTNGYDFHASEADVVSTMVALAAGTLNEKQLTDWIRAHVSAHR